MQECKSIFLYKILTLIAILVLLLVGVNVSAATMTWDEVVIWNLQWTRLKTCQNTSYCIYNSSSNNIFFVGANTKNFTITPNVLYEIKGEVNLSNSMPLYNNTEPFYFYYVDSNGSNHGEIECITGGITTSYGMESVDSTRGYTTRTVDCQFKTNKTNIKGFGWSTQVSNWNNIQVTTNIEVKILQDNSDIINNQNQNTQNIINNQNQNQQQTNEKLDDVNDNLSDINDSLTDSSAPDMGALNDTAGWLPPGPLDSIINLPLTILNSLTNLFSGGQCQPVQITLPFVNKTGELPCLNSLYEDINGLNVLFNVIFGAIGGYILYKYLVNLYVWVEKAIMMKETGYMNDWGGV